MSSPEIRRLIAENDPRRAATLLHEHFTARGNDQLASLALLQLNAQKRLSDQTVAGTLSHADINIEQAKINQALLYLADEYARLYERDDDDNPTGPTARRPGARRALLIGLSALLVLLVLGFVWMRRQAPAAPADFDLEVRLYESGAEHRPITGGQVNVRLGQAVPQSPRPLDGDGRARFTELSGRYWRDSVRVLYTAPADGYDYRVVGLSAAMPAQSRTIGVAVERTLQSSHVKMAVQRRGQPVAGADVIIDGKYRVRTDARGYFELDVPRPPGSTAEVRVEKDGRRLFVQQLTLSNDYQPLPIE